MEPCSRARLKRTSIATIVVALLAAGPAAAQQSAQAVARESVQDVLAFLLTNQAVQTGDFQKDQAATAATADTIARALLLNLTAQPIASSSGGFSYRFNSSLGTFERASESFGPILAERVETAAPGQLTIGFTFRFSNYTKLDGRNLTAGFTTTANRFTDEATPFDIDTLTMKLRTETFALTANVGIAGRLDVSGVLPLIALQLDGERTNQYRGRTFVQASGSANVAGLGDAILRTKVRLLGRGTAGLAIGAEFRLPTGRSEDLLGAGKAGVRVLLISSAEGAGAAAHANFFVARGGLSDETGVSGAAAFSPSPRVTVSAEALVRHVAALHAIDEVAFSHPTIAGVETIRLLPDQSGSTVSLLALGLKWNVAGAWLLNTSVGVPLVSRGLTATWTPSVGIEYSFGR